jgi:hypothetical protein
MFLGKGLLGRFHTFAVSFNARKVGKMSVKSARTGSYRYSQ